MAESLQRNKLYGYRDNSNLVLEAERDSRRRDEAFTDVGSLYGKLDGVRMGDRLSQTKRTTDELLVDKTTIKKREMLDAKEMNSSKKYKINDPDENNSSTFYNPSTQEFRIIYEEILYIIHSELGDQPFDIIRGAVDEAISILKSDELKESQKLLEVSKLVGKITSEIFSKLLNLSKKLSDFGQESNDTDTNKLDEEVGVAVVFDDENDDENDDGLDEDDEDDELIDEEANMSMLRGTASQSRESSSNIIEIPSNKIDAYWLQRELAIYYHDANASLVQSELILDILSIEDDLACENQLVISLGFDKFSFIKLLLSNRFKIYFCTKLKQAGNDVERQSLESEMLQRNPDLGRKILFELNQKISAEDWAQDRMTSVSRDVRTYDENFGGKKEMVIDDDFASEQDQKRIGDKNVINLESLVFEQGSHFMSNSNCELPSKSWRALKKGYEEVHVPAVRPIIPPDEKLVQISELPEWCQKGFEGIKSLNRIQSKLVNAALFGSDNMLLCAPTGAGKTNVALLCMLNQIGNHLRDDGSIDLNSFKIVYIAPMKALVQECVQSFSKRLAGFGINVRELSGDQNLTKQQIFDTHVIVSTPEKWDIITRKSGDRTYTQLVRLVIIDEIHLLHDDRGPVLEALVARIIKQVESTGDMVRLVGLSATLPNFEDVATFLRVNPEKGLFFFDNSFRPVPLQQQYIGITEKKAIKRFHLMNEICYEKVLQQAGRNQVLIFTHSRADTVKTAKALRDMAIENGTVTEFVKEDSASSEILKEEAASVKNADLKDLIPFGFAIHHAGMVRSDRTLVEDLFSDKHIQVLISTATLAWGVNLPCHTVIIKGTQMYSPEKGCWVELCPLDILQMMGRAGRFGLDFEGEGIILTTHSELQYYLSLMNQQLPVESQFIKRLPDMMNAEIVLGNIASIRDAITWIGYTYLYVRMLRSPLSYSINIDDPEETTTLSKRRKELCHAAATMLEKHHLLKYDRRSGTLQPTVLGRIASYYYVNHTSMETYNKYLKPDMSEIEIFRLFSISDEFKNLHVRGEEKLELIKLSQRVPIPIKESVEEPSSKVNVLLQAYISRLKLEGFSLSSDMIFVQQSAGRLFRALFEISLKKGWASLAYRLLNICKMTEKRLWFSQSPLRQFSVIPEIIIRKLERSSDIQWSQYFDLKPQDLGEMVKIPKMGKTLHKYIHIFPKLEIQAVVLPVTKSMIKMELTISCDFQYDTSVLDSSLLFWLFIEDSDGEVLLHSESVVISSKCSAVEQYLTIYVPMIEPKPPQYFVKLVSDKWLHSETVLPVSFRHLILPNKFPPPTELLDLNPVPISTFRLSSSNSFFNSIKTLNPIQTQCFPTLFESDNNILICAPVGAGKILCAKLAILRHIVSKKSSKVVYISPVDDLLDVVFDEFSISLPTLFGNIIFNKLTGDLNVDQKLVDSSSIIFSTSVNWDNVGRKWRQRKGLQDIGLYIFDDMHLIGGKNGHIYEMVVSRARFSSSQIGNSVRIVGLSSSLANAKDIAEWLGVSSTCKFNFSNQSRPLPLELHFVGFDMKEPAARALSMTKPAFNILMNNSSGKNSIVYVSSNLQCQLTAIDFIAFSKFQGSKFRVDENILDKFGIKSIDNITLLESLNFGIGFISESLSILERKIVEKLFEEGIIRTLICPYNYCWSLKSKSFLVILLDTIHIEGRNQNVTDYSIADILQMIGSACRPMIDDYSKAYIFCHASKKDYLKKFLQDSLPIESHLDHFFHDHLNSEIATRAIENKQDAIDFLTWTFFYKRISLNPNYYSLQGVSNRHISDHLSELIETVTSDLEASKCISIDDDFELSQTNFGMISSYYGVSYSTIELFANSVTSKTKVKGILDVLSAASEFSEFYIRSGEEAIITDVLKDKNSNLMLDRDPDSLVKIHALFSLHLYRYPMPIDLRTDLRLLLSYCIKLVPAIVDVIASHGWLKPAICAMELSQYLVQGLRGENSVLLQVPHINDSIIERLKILDPPIETVFDLIDMEPNERESALHLSLEELSDVAMFCNAYPSVDISYDVSSLDLNVGDSLTISVVLNHEIDEGVPIVSSRYPFTKVVSYWLLIGDIKRNTIMGIKKVNRQSKVTLSIPAFEEPGKYDLTMYFINDSYMGCDQEFQLEITVS